MDLQEFTIKLGHLSASCSCLFLKDVSEIFESLNARAEIRYQPIPVVLGYVTLKYLGQTENQLLVRPTSSIKNMTTSSIRKSLQISLTGEDLTCQQK